MTGILDNNGIIIAFGREYTTRLPDEINFTNFQRVRYKGVGDIKDVKNWEKHLSPDIQEADDKFVFFDVLKRIANNEDMQLTQAQKTKIINRLNTMISIINNL